MIIQRMKYDYWKERMIAYFESIQLNEIPRSQWIGQQKFIFLLNSKSCNVILCALLEEEYTKVHNFISAKQMWDTLAVKYKGTSQVNRNKLSLLTHKYEGK